MDAFITECKSTFNLDNGADMEGSYLEFFSAWCIGKSQKWNHLLSYDEYETLMAASDSFLPTTIDPDTGNETVVLAKHHVPWAVMAVHVLLDYSTDTDEILVMLREIFQITSIDRKMIKEMIVWSLKTMKFDGYENRPHTTFEEALRSSNPKDAWEHIYLRKTWWEHISQHHLQNPTINRLYNNDGVIYFGLYRLTDDYYNIIYIDNINKATWVHRSFECGSPEALERDIRVSLNQTLFQRGQAEFLVCMNPLRGENKWLGKLIRDAVRGLPVVKTRFVALHSPRQQLPSRIASMLDDVTTACIDDGDRIKQNMPFSDLVFRNQWDEWEIIVTENLQFIQCQFPSQHPTPVVMGLGNEADTDPQLQQGGNVELYWTTLPVEYQKLSDEAWSRINLSLPKKNWVIKIKKADKPKPLSPVGQDLMARLHELCEEFPLTPGINATRLSVDESTKRLLCHFYTSAVSGVVSATASAELYNSVDKTLPDAENSSTGGPVRLRDARAVRELTKERIRSRSAREAIKANVLRYVQKESPMHQSMLERPPSPESSPRTTYVHTASFNNATMPAVKGALKVNNDGAKKSVSFADDVAMSTEPKKPAKEISSVASNAASVSHTNVSPRAVSAKQTIDKAANNRLKPDEAAGQNAIEGGGTATKGEKVSKFKDAPLVEKNPVHVNGKEKEKESNQSILPASPVAPVTAATPKITSALETISAPDLSPAKPGTTASAPETASASETKPGPMTNAAQKTTAAPDTAPKPDTTPKLSVPDTTTKPAQAPRSAAVLAGNDLLSVNPINAEKSVPQEKLVSSQPVKPVQVDKRVVPLGFPSQATPPRATPSHVTAPEVPRPEASQSQLPKQPLVEQHASQLRGSTELKSAVVEEPQLAEPVSQQPTEGVTSASGDAVDGQKIPRVGIFSSMIQKIESRFKDTTAEERRVPFSFITTPVRAPAKRFAEPRDAGDSPSGTPPRKKRRMEEGPNV